MDAVGGKTCGYLNCSKELTCESADSERALFCDQHATDGMGGTEHKLCSHSGCFKHRKYGAAGRKWNSFCAEHAVGVETFTLCKKELEEISSKEPQLGVACAVKIEIGSAHASDGTMNAYSGQCTLEGCLKGALFGFEGSERATFCAKHAVDGMVDIANRTCADGYVPNGPLSRIAGAGDTQLGAEDARGGLGNVAGTGWKCASEGSPIGPSYNTADDWRREFFAKHAPDGAVAMASMPCARAGYLDQASYGVTGVRPNVFYAGRVDGMVDVVGTKCRRGGCFERQSCRAQGSDGTGLCFKHASDGMEAEPVAVASERSCLQPGCYMAPSNGLGAGWRAGFCFGHANGKSPSVDKKNCRREGCLRMPYFGVEGSKKREYCASHRLDGMVDIRRSRCGTKGCMMLPSYKFPGTRGKGVCAKHAVGGMIPVLRHDCASENCPKQAIFGNEKSRSRVFCAEHAQEGMVKTAARTCAHEGCRKSPNYGVMGTKLAVLCAKHAVNGMVNIATRWCAHVDCSKTANFGTKGSKKREFCTQHKLSGMVNISAKRCRHEGCLKVASHGLEKSKTREFCAKHATEGMVSLLPTHGNNAKRTPKAKVPRVPVQSAEKTPGEGASLAEEAGGIQAFL